MAKPALNKYYHRILILNFIKNLANQIKGNNNLTYQEILQLH